MEKQVMPKVLMVAAAVYALTLPASVFAFDEEAAKAIAKKNDCFKCHAIDKTKKGPSYKKIAEKYKGKAAEGETKMTKNMTTSPMVKLEDGTEEEHKAVEATPAEIKNLIAWILSL